MRPTSPASALTGLFTRQFVIWIRKPCVRIHMMCRSVVSVALIIIRDCVTLIRMVYRLKKKYNDWLLADSSFITSRHGLCMLVNFSYPFCSRLTSFKINLLKLIFQEHYQSVILFGSRSGHFVCPNLDPNCLQR